MCNVVDMGQELNDGERWEELGDMQDKHWITIDRQLIGTQTQTQKQKQIQTQTEMQDKHSITDS